MSQSRVSRPARTPAWALVLVICLCGVEPAPGQSRTHSMGGGSGAHVAGLHGPHRGGGPGGLPGCRVPPLCPPILCGPVAAFPILVAPYPYPPAYPYGVGPVPAMGPPALTPGMLAGMEADPGRLDLEVRRARAAAEPARPSRKDRDRATERVRVGDRLFRAGELVKASERYAQAIQADSGDAKPYVRLAQVAVVRNRYSEAADRIREAQAVQPGWMILADDVQSLFGEPAAFAAEIGELESHLQADPDDRDAWLVLGAELYLSGRTRQAADVFLRLTDRLPDDTLAAFLRASRAGEDRE